jgi:ribokinase
LDGWWLAGERERGLGHVVVVGSVNADYSVRIAHLPQPGETVTGGVLEILPGGKGANQAHAAARLGARVTLVAAVGDDAAAEQAVADLSDDGISTSGLLHCPGPSGTAVILVDEAGENMIAVAPGANERLTPAEAARLLGGQVTAGAVILASLEIPLATALAAADAALAAGATLVLNPAPGQVLPAGLMHGVILTPNEGEVLRLTPAANGEGTAVAGLLDGGAAAVIVTRGSRGATLFRADQPPADFPAPKVQVVDTVGAGDAFNGALATALAGGLPLETAVTAAVEAGAFACTGAGARAALPRAKDIPALAVLA